MNRQDGRCGRSEGSGLEFRPSVSRPLVVPIPRTQPIEPSYRTLAETSDAMDGNRTRNSLLTVQFDKLQMCFSKIE